MTNADASPSDGQLRRSAEALHAHELEALAQEDTRARPSQWRL